MIADTDGYIKKFDVFQEKFEQMPEKMKSFDLWECFYEHI